MIKVGRSEVCLATRHDLDHATSIETHALDKQYPPTLMKSNSCPHLRKLMPQIMFPLMRRSRTEQMLNIWETLGQAAVSCSRITSTLYDQSGEITDDASNGRCNNNAERDDHERRVVSHCCEWCCIAMLRVDTRRFWIEGPCPV